MNRDFLVYVPTKRGELVADLWGPDREYDIALNDYTGGGKGTLGADFPLACAGHKWPVIAKLAGGLWRYKAVCFLDDDIKIGTLDLNRLFHAGLAFDLDVWQAALSDESYIGWPHTRRQPGILRAGILRAVPFVEIMMPVFSRRALKICRPTFTENVSGWGIDFLWPLQFASPRFAVLDFIVATHTRPIQSEVWRMPDGRTPLEECFDLVRKYGIKGPQYGRFG